MPIPNDPSTSNSIFAGVICVVGAIYSVATPVGRNRSDIDRIRDEADSKHVNSEPIAK